MPLQSKFRHRIMLVVRSRSGEGVEDFVRTSQANGTTVVSCADGRKGERQGSSHGQDRVGKTKR
eukprot:9136348-Ditylum_brightwellii.AAC.1